MAGTDSSDDGHPTWWQRTKYGLPFSGWYAEQSSGLKWLLRATAFAVILLLIFGLAKLTHGEVCC
jgi:hypothetical protein